MTYENPDEYSDDDALGPNRDRDSGILGAVRHFLEMLQEMDEQDETVRHGHATSKRGVVDYSVHIGSVRPDDHRTSVQSPVTPDAPVAVDETDEGIVVHIDLPEVQGETVTAGVDSRTLVVGVDNTVYRRIRLPRRGLTVVAGAYRNGVLELHLEAEETPEEDGEKNHE